jgi:hypothetical protein
MVHTGRSILGTLVVTLFALMAGTAQAQTFRIAQWNLLYGWGLDAMPGGDDSTFTRSDNCNTNAWGMQVTQRVLATHIKNDPQVVALVVNEGFGPPEGCATPDKVKNEVLIGWQRTGTPGDTGEREGVAIFARYGFAGPQTPTQIGTAPSRWVWRAPVWLDAAHTQSLVIYGTHLSSVATNGANLLTATLNDRNNNVPHVIFGDLNTPQAVSDCSSVQPLTTLTNAGYTEAWPLVNPTDPGYTATAHAWSGTHNWWCGIPDYVPYKRIDLLLFWQPTGGPFFTVHDGVLFMTPPEFGVKDDKPSDHYGVKFRLSLGSCPGCDTEDPFVSFNSPTENQTVAGNVSISVTATDNVGVTRVDLKREDGTTIHSWTSAPYTYTWNSTTVGDGTHALQAIAHDAAGNSYQRTVTINVDNPPSDWTAVVNAIVTGSTLQKNAGCEGCLDSGGISVNTIASGDGYVQFTSSFEKRLYAGLGTNRTNSTGNAEIQFAFSIWPDRTWDIRESNSYKTGGAHALNDVFKIAIESGVVKYYVNGSPVYTSLVAPMYPIGLDVSMLSLNATVSNPSLFSSGGGGPVTSDVIWINAVNTTPNGSTLQKTSGCTECADGGGISQQTIDGGNGSIEFTPSFQHRFYAGLGTDRSASTNRAVINYAFTFWLDATWDIRENDSWKAGGAHESGDVFKIAIEGGVVKYYKNGGLVYTSTVTPTYPLGLDTSMLTIGSTVGSAKITR